MDALLPPLTVVMDAVGLGLTAWLGLTLLTQLGSWPRARAAALALGGLALTFALAVADDVRPLLGANTTSSLLRLLLLAAPLGWLFLARRFAPVSLRARVGVPALLVAVAALATVAVTLLMGPLEPALLGRSWYFLPAQVLTLLLATVATFAVARATQRVARGGPERSAMGAMTVGALALAVGGALLAADLVFGLTFAPLRLAPIAGEARLAASALLLAASFALAGAVRSQARADGVSHWSHLSHSLAVTLALAALFLGLGGLAVWYFRLPRALLGLFGAFAVLSDWLAHGTRRRVERALYRGPTGKLRRTLRAIADDIETPQKLPPGVRPVLSRLARQVNSPQLGLALRDPKGNDFRIVAALRRSWEGQTVDVPHPDVWEERALGGWNKPLRVGNQTIGVIASEKTGPLSAVQVQLLDEAAREIVDLLNEAEAVAQRREGLQKALDDFQAAAARLDPAPDAKVPTRGSLRRGVEQVLQRYNQLEAVGNSPLSRLKLVEQSMGAAARSVPERGQFLRDLVATLVEQLRPLEGEPPSLPPPEWHPYLALSRPFLQGEAPEETMRHLGLTAGAFRQAQGRGLEAIARTLAELEAGVARNAARRATPVAPAALPGAATTRATPAASGGGYGGTAGAWGSMGAAPPAAQPPPQPQPAAPKANPLGSLTSRLRREDKPADADAPRRDAAPSPLGGLTGRLRSGDSDGTAAPKATPAAKPGEPKANPLSGLTGRFRSADKPADGEKAAASPAKGPLAARFGGLTGALGRKGGETGETDAPKASATGAPGRQPPLGGSAPRATPSTSHTRAVPKPPSKPTESTRPDDFDDGEFDARFDYGDS